MIHFIQNAPSDIIALSVDGKLTEEDYKKFNRMVRLKDHTDKLKLYIEINNWEGITLKAIFEDIKASFKHYNDINKMVVAGDVAWLQNWVKVGNVLSPETNVKAFDISERKKAIKWLKD